LTISANISAGNGNDDVIAGDGNNTVTLGNGNDTVWLGNGNNVEVEGNGNDEVTAGNGDNLIVAGLGHHVVRVGNGSNILIDGNVQLTQSGDSLQQVLDDWVEYGDLAADVASIRSRLAVTYNTRYANTLDAGSGLDWFWYTDAQDKTNRKPTDLLN
jgi:Ca2+-binding RTX toxin-like protein